MATPTAKTRMNGATKTKTTATTKVAAKPNNPALAKLTSWVRSTYGVNLLKREETLAVAAYYGLRERLGMKLQTEISLKSNGSKRFDWSKWNSQVFPGIFGQPTKLKVSVEHMALVASAFDHEISEDPETGLAQLAEFNRKSLEDRKLTKAIKDGIGDSMSNGFDGDAFEEDEFDDDDLDTEASDELDDADGDDADDDDFDDE
jgi:hypothetical protein